jgi:outer membrane protein assembly factor BamB/tetratricopeptide (TPR) repeat protein
MPRLAADRLLHSARITAVGLLAAAGLTISGGHANGQAQPAMRQQLAVDDAPDGVAGKEHNEFVFVRDSATALEKFTLAQKMERLKEWNKSADLYQEVLEKYRDRVIPAGKDSKGVINRYTSVTWGVLQQLSKWPQEGLDVYRGRYETKAAELVASAKGDDLAPLYEAFSKYFVTEAAKQAGLKLIDANLERGEYASAAEIGDQLLNMYPKDNLIAERPSVLFRTGLAYMLVGDPESRGKAAERAKTLATESPKEIGVVRGKDVNLSDALKEEFNAISKQVPDPALVASASDSWPTFGGGPTRNTISNAKANPGTRLYSIPLAKPNFTAANAQMRSQMQAMFEEQSRNGSNICIFPAVDRGELFFQDGTRVYAHSLESGIPLGGWLRTYPESNGQFVMKEVTGSTRTSQQTLTVTDRYVLAVMGQQDRQALMQMGINPQNDPKLVCLDRTTGHEMWRVDLKTNNQIPAGDDKAAIQALTLSGSPLVVGDTVLMIGRSNRNNNGEDCYVLSFDINTGKFRWACYVASAGVPMNGMYGIQPQLADNTSHLAYANGRVYCLSNLGAVAALDAYSGTIVWLNIYPMDPPVMPGRGFAPAFSSGSQNGSTRMRSWQMNPVLLSDGKVFVLPSEGKNLLVYDAASGKEVKRISLDAIARWTWENRADRPDALVGVMGNKMVLAGDSRILVIDWPKVDDNFPGGPDMEQVIWRSVFAPPRPAEMALWGRPFLTASSIYTASWDKIRRIDMQTGRAAQEYPPGGRAWEESEGPGNLVVSGDHIIIAGSTAIDVYTDLGLATAKLDKELQESPTDPEPRLRYAEVMFVAGQGDAAVQRLDEAVKLMGGLDKLPVGTTRDRLFNDALTFAIRSSAGARPGSAERVIKFFDRAAASASSPQQQVQYRVARAKYADQAKDATLAVKLYQEILATPETRAVSLTDEQTSLPIQAEELAEKSITQLVRQAGPTVYEPYEQEAQKAVTEAKEVADNAAKAEKLLQIAQIYPNASVASSASMSAAEAFEAGGKPREAIRVLRQMWFKYQNGPGRTQILEAIARNYLAVPDRNRAEMAGTAAARLASAVSLATPDTAITKDLKLPDGTVVSAAGTSLSKALDDVRHLSSKEAGKSLPDFKIPPQPKSPPWVKPFVKVADPAALTLPDATALVPASRDFARPDRVVTWSNNGLSFFATGNGMPKAPIAKCPAFAAADGAGAGPARGVSWNGDTALVWGNSRVVAIDSTSGKILWQMDLSKMSQLEILRGSDAPGVAVNEGGQFGANQVIINGRARMIRGNVIVQQQAIAQPGQPQPPVNVNPALPVPPPNGGREQVAEVRPIGDRALIISNAGRVLVAELASGKVNWQARMSENTPERVVATEDFTVVKAGDDLTVRMFALDTFSGRVLGNKAYARQSNSYPVNLALSPEGTLVYTLPDKLCLKDLYKPWDEEEKVAQSAGPNGTPAQPIYIGASQPGQLVIAEGRILALADSISTLTGVGVPSNEKYVRVHSLETGQMLSMRYTADGSKREVDQILTSGTKDWNVMIRNVGARVYVVGPKQVYGYNLDKPGESWRGSTNMFDSDTLQDDVNFRDAFIGTRHLVVLDQPGVNNNNGPAAAAQPPVVPAPGVVVQPVGPAAAPAAPAAPAPAAPVSTGQYRLHVFARYPSASTPNKSESGRLDHSFTVSDPAGVAPQWQACDGGFFYATGDGKVKMLLGSEQPKP